MNERPLSIGCSGFSWHTADVRHLLGRTYDMFGDLKANRITLVAPGYELAVGPGDGTRRIRLDHGFIGNAIQGSTSPIFTDGVSEHGLMGTLQNYPGYGHYDTQKGNGRLDLHPAFLVPYMLGTCKSVEEVARAAGGINLTGEPIFSAHMSVHYLFSDESGEAIIIEPDEGGIRVHRDTIGVMTNAPGYEWQYTNLKNYVAVSNVHTPPRDLLGRSISTFGSGTGGSFGLPGGFSSPDRFVRLAFAKNYATPGSSEKEGVSRMFDTFSIVHVPEGMLVAKEGSPECEKTLCTSVMCAESRTYYFSPYGNRRISSYSCKEALRRLESGQTLELYDIDFEEDIRVVV